MDQIATKGQIRLGMLNDHVPLLGENDVTHLFSTMKSSYFDDGLLSVGEVTQYNPTTHTARVRVWEDVIPCVFCDEILSYSYGYSSSMPAREGELVLVYKYRRDASFGLVMGRVGYNLTYAADGDKYNDPDYYHRRSYLQDEKNLRTWDINIPSIIKPLMSPDDNSTSIRTHFRPTDVYPGEFAHLNQHNCGIKGGMFSATLMGGGASLRMSALSNSARLVCDTYMRYTMTGSLVEFHNGRYLSSERNIAMHQEERLGASSIEGKVWEEDSVAPIGGENQTIRPRIKELEGFFGNLTAKFCMRPDTSGGIRVQGGWRSSDAAPKEAGVSRETIDPSGQYRFSAAGMIVIERTGRIPVPVRKSYSSDKGHDIPTTPYVQVPFEHDDSDPAYRQLELFDRQAYDLKNQYSRVDGEGVDNPDYDVPQEEQMKPLKDAYDEGFNSNETVKLEKYDKRRAGVFIGEDGSVIIRDAWASEIVMIGGNVTISCAGNVIMAPAKTSLTVAGDDIVQKARNSVDIHASEHDVRLSAARNMEIVGGGDESTYSGGVVIESRGSGVNSWDGSSGEASRLSGITLKTNNQAVVVDGKEVNIRSKSDTRIISGDESIDGRVSVSAKTIKQRADSVTTSSSDGTAHLKVSNGSVEAAASTVGINAENSVAITRGRHKPIINWSRGDDNVAERRIPEIDSETSSLSDEKEASGSFSREELNKMSFGFRTSEECRTDKNWTLGASGPFTMYQPAWAQVLNLYDTLKGVEPETYEEKAEWGPGRPFPGKDAEDSGVYAQIEGSPKNLTDGGINASRKSVESKTNIVKKSLKDSYMVLKS